MKARRWPEAEQAGEQEQAEYFTSRKSTVLAPILDVFIQQLSEGGGVAKLSDKLPELVLTLIGILVTVGGMKVTYDLSAKETERQIARDKAQYTQELEKLKLEMSGARDLELLRQKNEEERLAIARRREDADKEEKLKEQELTERKNRQDVCISKAEGKIRYRYESEQLLTAAFGKFQDDLRAFFVDLVIFSDPEASSKQTSEEVGRILTTGMLRASSSAEAFTARLMFDGTPLPTGEIDKAKMQTMAALANAKTILALPEPGAPVASEFRPERVSARVTESTKAMIEISSSFGRYLLLARDAAEKERVSCVR